MDLYFKDAMNAAMHTPYKIDRKSWFSEDSIGSEMIGSIDDISIKTMEIYDLKEKQVFKLLNLIRILWQL